MQLDVSVIIPWCARPEIKTTLKENSLFFDKHKLEVIVVNCGGDGAFLRSALDEVGLKQVRWIELDCNFNKSLALNIGSFAARAERLFFLDTDIVFKEDFLSSAMSVLNETCFVTVDRVYESQPVKRDEDNFLDELVTTLCFVVKGNRRAQIVNHVRFDDGSRGGPGLILLWRDHFLKVDGMNSDLRGVGWEDNDLILRLQFQLSLEHRRVGSAVHLSHEDAGKQLGINRAEADQLNFASCYKNYNAGYLLGTYTDDVATWKDSINRIAS